MKPSLIFLFLFSYQSLLISQDINDYHYKIDNRINDSKDGMHRDSILHIKETFYTLYFNFHWDLIKDRFNSTMWKVDSLSYLDSTYLSTGVIRPPIFLKIAVGELVPFKISQAIISEFHNIPNYPLTLTLYWDRPELVPGKKRDLRTRRVVIGSLNCPYSIRVKYISNKEVIELLLNAKSQEDFIKIFWDHDEMASKFEAYINTIDRHPRFNGCEDVEEVETRIGCSRGLLNQYLQSNIVEKIEFDRDFMNVRLFLDSTGKVTDVDLRTTSKHPNKALIKQILLDMPNWVPQKDAHGKPEESSTMARFHFN